MAEYNVEELKELIDKKDVTNLKKFIVSNNLIIKDGKIQPNKENSKKLKTLAAFWDQRQLARKILLNSLYGALLKF